MKNCSNKICNQLNPQLLSEFEFRGDFKHLLKSWCRSCYKDYRFKNRLKISKRKKLWCLANRERKRETQRIYDFSHKEQRANTQRKRRSVLENRLRGNLRARFNMAFKNEYKTGHAIKDLGCSINDLKWWLEFWFEEGMNWTNYGKGLGKWNIDHIFPVTKININNRNEVLKCCNYKNLQPLWHSDNVIKSNKI